MKNMFLLSHTHTVTRLYSCAFFSAVFLLTQFSALSQVNTGGNATTANHQKQIIGYLSNWDAWKAATAGVPQQGALNHLNIDYAKYTVLNYSFFGVAVDGSLHSGDFRDKNIYQTGVVQQPNDIFFTDTYSSWDMHLLFGELELAQYISQDVADRATAQGFQVTVNGSTWSHPTWGLFNKPLPIPLHKVGGAPGVLELAHSKGVKVMASIGGWSMCKHFPEMAADATKRQKFINDCVKLVNTGFDGIDLDWEFVGPFAGMNFTGSQADFVNFTNLVQAIRNAIGPNKLITAALSADPAKLQGFEWTKLNSIMNYYNIMTYDYNGGWSNKAGHNSPLFNYDGAEAPNFNWQTAYTALVNLGVPKNKINMGSPFYGRGVVTSGNAALNAPTVKRSETVQPDGPITTCADYVNWPKDVYDGTPNYFFVKQVGLAAGSGWTRGWDNQAKAPYLTKGSYFLSYDDEESIGHKAQYIVDNQLAGTIIWTVFGDLELSGSPTQFGSKLIRYPTVKSVLVNKINEVFASGISNPPPTVSITSPANNSSFTAPANITINASATDNGSVTKVEFFQGTTKLGEDTSSPYSFAWNNVAAGTYSLIAIATDNGGATTNSFSISITVTGTTTLPAPWQNRDIGAVAAAGSTTYSSGTFTVKGSGADIWGAADEFQYVYQSLSGNGTIVAQVNSLTNTNGWAKAGVMIRESLNANSIHAMTVITPSNGVSYQRRTTTGGTSASTSVAGQTVPKWLKIQRAGNTITSSYSSDGTTWTVVGAGTVTMATNVFIGLCLTSHSDGTITSASISNVNVTTSSNVPPTGSITSPSNGATFTAPATITINATASDTDGTIAKVDFFNGTTLLGTDTSSPYSFSWTNVAAGSYSLTARATDNAGGTGTSPVVNITVNGASNVNPTASITAPSNNATYTAPASVTINATATDTDGTISKVDFYNGTTLLGTDTSNPYSFSWTSVAAGSYSLTAKATDNAGGTGTSAAVNITVSGGSDICSSTPQYVENGGYVAGSLVKNVGSQYECKPYPFTGWCNGAAWAYAPGTGTYWQDAWILKGACTGGSGARSASSHPSQGSESEELNQIEILSLDIDGLSIYPNPGVSGRPHSLGLTFKENPGQVKVHLRDINGVSVFNKSYLAPTRTVTVELPGLSRGMYIINVQGEKKIWMKKYIIE